MKNHPSIVNDSKLHKFLGFIQFCNHLDSDTPSEIYSGTLNKQFSGYTSLRDSAIKLHFLEVDFSYTVGTENQRGENMEYFVTYDGLKFLKSFSKNRLKQLRTDKKTRRLNKQRISKRGYNKVKYDDVSVQSIKSVIDGISYDLEQVQTVCDTFSLSKSIFSLNLLVQIEERDYTSLKRSESDNRIYNLYTNLPSDLKPFLTVNELPYFKTVDIRSCHWSLWGRVVVEQLKTPPTLLSLPYCYDKRNMLSELNRWESLFLNKEIDPKHEVSKLTGIPLKKVKDVMNSYINSRGFEKQKNGEWKFVRSSGPYERLNDYVKTNFPALYSFWITTNVKDTGCKISKWYETKIIQDPRIYQMGERLGYVLGYENDGFSIYTNNRSEGDFGRYVEFIEELSKGLIGIQLIFVGKVTKTEDFLESSRISKETKRNEKCEDFCNAKLKTAYNKEEKSRRHYFFNLKELERMKKEGTDREELQSAYGRLQDVKREWYKQKERFNGILLDNKSLIESLL